MKNNKYNNKTYLLAINMVLLLLSGQGGGGGGNAGGGCGGGCGFLDE